MKRRLNNAWQSRSPRERTFVAILAVILGVALYVWLVQSAGEARTRLQANVMILRAQAGTLEQQALELERLRATPTTPVSRSDLGAQVQAQVDAAGLGHALARIDAADANQVVVAFGALAFADWLDWVASLNAQHVRLAACRIEALPESGMVSVSATLLRAGH